MVRFKLRKDVSLKTEMHSKKAQSAEFIGIAVLVTSIVLIAIFSRMQSAGSMLSRAETVLRGFRVSGISTTGAVMPYVTAKDSSGNSLGVPIEELMGVYSCYGAEKANYGNGEINITTTLRESMDSVYGKEAWALILKNESDNSKPLFLTSSQKANEGLPQFSPYISYDFVFSRPCKRSSKEAGVLFVLTQ
jgi:hypothetical protein